MTIPRSLLQPVPEWDQDGFLPGITGAPTEGSAHPPYPVHLTDLVEKFAFSHRREDILKGFLEFRAALHQIGLSAGIQWINGSFVNDKEFQEDKEPGDIDVVTLYVLPENQTQETLVNQYPDLFQSRANKVKYMVDSYFVELSASNLFYMTKSVAFWNNLWHHTEEGRRKGFLAVDLSDEEEQDAKSILNQKITERARDE